jgi:hypothetical protein
MQFLVGASNMQEIQDAVTKAKRQDGHRTQGDTWSVLVNGFVVKISQALEGGTKKQKTKQSCAKEPQVVWQCGAWQGDGTGKMGGRTSCTPRPQTLLFW